MIRAATLAAFVMFVAGQGGQNAASTSAAAKALASIQGTWVVSTINGQALADSGTEMTLTVTGDKYAQSVNGEVNERGTLKLDPSKKPMTLDLNIVEGNDGGKLQLGVIEITGDTLTGKLGVPGEPTRPTSMAPEEGYFLVVAVRKK